MMVAEMAGRLAGKVCILTGTGGGMGRATALTFAREGASVVGCDVAVEPAEETGAAGRIRVLCTPPGSAHFGCRGDAPEEDGAAARRDEVDLVFYLTRTAWPH